MRAPLAFSTISQHRHSQTLWMWWSILASVLAFLMLSGCERVAKMRATSELDHLRDSIDQGLLAVPAQAALTSIGLPLEIRLAANRGDTVRMAIDLGGDARGAIILRGMDEGGASLVTDPEAGVNLGTVPVEGLTLTFMFYFRPWYSNIQLVAGNQLSPQHIYASEAAGLPNRTLVYPDVWTLQIFAQEVP